MTARGAQGVWGGGEPPHAGGPPGGASPRGLAELGRLTGMRLVATAALTLLTFGAVFAVTAGQREDLATRTAALRQTLGAAQPLSRSIAVSAAWSAMSSALSFAKAGNTGAAQLLTDSQMTGIASQLHGDFDGGLVHLAPPAAEWMSLTSLQRAVTSKIVATPYPVELEVSYRQPFGDDMRLVAGHFPGPVRSVPVPVQRFNFGQSEPRFFAPLLQVAVTAQTAATLGLHPGSKVDIGASQGGFGGSNRPITLEVTGIVAPRDPSATFWTADATVLKPDLQQIGPLENIWYAGVLAGPSELAAVQEDFGPGNGLTAQWLLPLSPGSPSGDQAQSLYDALNLLSTQAVPLTGDVAPVAPDLTVTPYLLPVLKSFLATEQSVDALLWLLYVSLAVACLVVFLLTARMIALRRAAELAVFRARGASLRQIVATSVLGTALTCVPAAVAGAALAVLLVPGSAPAGGWWGPAAVLTVAVCAPAAVAAWQQRLTVRPPRRLLARSWGRLVAEATAIAAAVAGLIVLRQQGLQPGSGVDLYTSAAPVLIAIPVVIVVLRVYPLVLRAALRGTARQAGAAAFLGLARASRSRLAAALPAFALVLALSISAFAGMVRNAVSNGEVTASWQAAGADATVIASFLGIPNAMIEPAALRAAAGAPGVTHSAALWQATWSTSGGQQLTGLVVDPATYAAVVAATQTFPQVPAGQLKKAPAGTPQPVLASSQAAAELGSGVTTLRSGAAVSPVRVRVAGVLSGTPALPGGGAFVIIPLAAIRSTATPPVPVGFNELLLTGSDIDKARVSAVVRDMIPLGLATFRSDILNGLTTAPLQHGTFQLFELALAVAAALGLAVMLLELALGAAEREETLARLASMGLGDGQRARVAALELLPAVVAAALAAWACAIALPPVVGPAINLTAFTGSSAAVALRPDAAAVALPLAGLLVVAAVALAIEIRSGRRRRLTASLRTGS